MNPGISSSALIVATLGWTAATFQIAPFEHINAGLDYLFGALPSWTKVENMYKDRFTQEVSRGEHPLESFRILRNSWKEHPGVQRIVLMGNSQMQMTSLAPGERLLSEPEKTYTDQMADYYKRTGWRKVLYRLSAGALSYQEMLWYAAYLASNPEIKPEFLLVQLNYQNFANDGIRSGMLEMLADPQFRALIEHVAHGGRPESSTFQEALRQYEFENSDTRSEPSVNARPPGYAVETAFRRHLDRLPDFLHRDRMKESFVFMLIRFRTYFIRLNPAGPRSLAGARLRASRAALEDLVELSTRSGMQVILFQAPTNPAVPLYRTATDDRAYHDFCASLASRFRIDVLDFEHSAPANQWGMELNVPDPLHLSRQGHRLLAGLMLSALEGRQ